MEISHKAQNRVCLDKCAIHIQNKVNSAIVGCSINANQGEVADSLSDLLCRC